MKLIKGFLLAVSSIILWTGCEHTVSTETIVHEDGTLDKTIAFWSKDSKNAKTNVTFKQDFLDSISIKGWIETREMEKNLQESDTSRTKSRKEIVTFRKTFHSANAANTDLASPNDSLFRITSKFEKKFRWFYTYIYYSDTYKALNKLEYPQDDYLTQEDYAFIERLPKEGAPISKADSLYLDQLTSKIFDTYGERALFESMYARLVDLIEQKGIKLGMHWIDSLQRNKEKYFSKFKNDGKKEGSNKNDGRPAVLDSIEMLMHEKMEVDSLFKDLQVQTDFMSYASEGIYSNKITMPWDVVNTNADSISGRQLFWSPPTIKFLLKDYTMFAESRKLNLWPVAVSILFVGFAGFVFVRKKNSRRKID